MAILKRPMPISHFLLFLACSLFLAPLSLPRLHSQDQKKKFPLLKQRNGVLSPRQSSKQICFYEKERRLFVLNLSNRSRKPLLTHFSRSTAQLIAARLGLLTYVSAKGKRKLLCLAPEGIQKEYEHRRYYSREGSFRYRGPRASSVEELHKSQKDRVRLIVKHEDSSLNLKKRGKETSLLKAAERLEAEYLLAGEISKLPKPGPRGETFVYKFYILDAILKRTHTFSRKLKQGKPYAKVDEIVEEVQKFLWAKEDSLLVSFHSPKPGAMVYLDEAYLGRTPLSRKVLAGKYELLVVQEGHASIRKKIDIFAHKKREFKIENTRQKGSASIALQSDPSGAEVYLNLRYLGKTPLRMANLPSGTHRLTLRKDSYIDSYLGLELKPNQTQKLHVHMKLGDTVTHYKEWQQVLGSLTYFDLTLYSFLSSVAFYASYLYFTSQEEKSKDREQVNGNGDSSRSGENSQYARNSANLSLLSFLSAGYFLYQALSLPPPNLGEVSILLSGVQKPRISNQYREKPVLSSIGGVLSSQSKAKWEWDFSLRKTRRQEAYEFRLRSPF